MPSGDCALPKDDGKSVRVSSLPSKPRVLVDWLDRFGILIVLAALLIFFLVERVFPLRREKSAILHRLVVNGMISALTFSTALLIVRPASVATVKWSERDSFGLLNWLGLTSWIEALVGFLLLDLSFYYWHRLNHGSALFWRFHNAHHTDPDLDASTGFRFHFGEVALSVVFRVFQIAVIGVNYPLFVVYEFVFQLDTYFHHSNVRMPPRLEKALNFVVVTPRMHALHHSQVREHTNSNFSVIFSFWDRLHRSFLSDIAQSDIVIGVPGYAKPQDNNLLNVFLAPFRRQREYWTQWDLQRTKGSSTGFPRLPGEAGR